MKYRRLGSSDLTVSAIGFGAWGIGGDSYGSTDDAMSQRALETAFDQGINFFDTSDLYGAGHSERLIGTTFQSRRAEVVIATKGGMLPHTTFEMPQDFSRTFLRRQLEKSLRRLRTDYVDLYQLHSPTLADLAREGAVETALEMQREGKARAIALSARSPKDARDAIREYALPVVEVNFNLLDQRAIDDGLFDLATAQDVGIIARTPLCFGFLTGTLTGEEEFGENDHRKKWPREQMRRWAESACLFRELAASLGLTPTQLALAYSTSFEPVGTAIPGMLTPQEVLENCTIAAVALSGGILESIREIYTENDLHKSTTKPRVTAP